MEEHECRYCWMGPLGMLGVFLLMIYAVAHG